MAIDDLAPEQRIFPCLVGSSLLRLKGQETSRRGEQPCGKHIVGEEALRVAAVLYEDAIGLVLRDPHAKLLEGMAELSSAEEARRAVFSPLPCSVRLLAELTQEDHLFVLIEVGQGTESGPHQSLEIVEGMKDLSIRLRDRSTWRLIIL
jgi:hypothetical protein